MRVNYYQRAASYARIAEEFEAQGLTASANRALEKAAFWDSRGDRQMQMFEVWWTLLLRHEHFLKRVTRKHRWKCCAWGARCWHMRGGIGDRKARGARTQNRRTDCL